MKIQQLFILCGLLAAGAQLVHADNERRRSLPTVQVAGPTTDTAFSSQPSDIEFLKYSGLSLPLVPQGETSTDENVALAAALTSHKANGVAYDFTAIDTFLQSHPASPWKAGLLANKGLALRYHGFIGSSFPVFEDVWLLAKDAETPSVRAYADRAIAELIAIKAGLGRQNELGALFAQIEGRSFKGKSAELVANARLGVASMENNPERSFNCGPAALVNVLGEIGHGGAADTRIMAQPATTNGLSLAKVAELADQVGFDQYAVAFRETDEGAYPTPSILHWKEGHFSALLRQDGNRYLIQDPTLGRKMWVPEAALDVEASGYFLIAQSELPQGWRSVDDNEAATVWGKGKTTLTEDGATRPYDEKSCGGNGENRGMPAYSVHLLLASLSITDTPIWVNTPYGNPVAFTVTYNQRETSLPDPSLAVQSNMGANWTHNWQSWADGSGSEIANVGYQTVTLTVPGGGLETFELNAGQTAYELQRDTQATLAATYSGSTLTGYTLTYPDGSIYTYGLSRVSGSDTRYFLTEMADPYGNAVTLNYDADYRLTTVVTDALATAALTFVYEYDSNGDPVLPATTASASEDYLIKEVIGPQGRYASLSYDADLRIDGITDMAGLEANFGYGTSYMSSMTTPYGQTSFQYPSDAGVSRSILITDPEGQQERFEFTREVNVETLWGTETAPTGTAKGPHFADDLNTFHWDKGAMETAVNPDGTMDYSQAVLYHWMQADTQRAASVLHSVKQPLENRDWYIYPDTLNNDLYTIGSTNKPTAIKRFVKDETGTTVERTTSFEYNTLWRVTRSIDPKDRELEMNYAANGIDLLNVKQRTGSGTNDFATLTTFDYDEDNDGNDDFPRLPSLIDGADGVRLDMTFNSKGQILSVTRQEPDGQGGFTNAGTTDYTYDTQGTGETYGFLIKVEGPSVGGQRPTNNYTYDAYGRVRTATDTDNFKLTYSYDDLDRITQVDYPDGTYVTHLFEPVSEGLDLIAFIDRMGRMSQFRHDDVGRVVQSIDPKGQSTIYQWCGCGSLNTLIDPKGQATTWLRDVQGRLEKKIYPDNSEISYAYEPESGLLSKVTDQRGFDKEFKYFVDGNIEEISFDDGGTSDPDYIDAPTVNYTYDLYFNRTATLTTEGDPDDYSYQYYGFTGNGNANRLETVTISKVRNAQAVNTDVDYAYDSLGRLLTRSFKGDTETYAYDLLDRLDTLNDPLGDFDYGYDGLTSRILSVQHSVSGVDGIRTDLAYQSKVAGGLERKVPFLGSITHSNPSGIVSAHAYQRNKNGWIDLWQQYDSSQWESHAYRYDQEGQLETDRKYDGLDQNSPLLESHEFRYDLAGNRTLAKDSSGQLNEEHNNLNQLDGRSSEGGVLFNGTISEPGRVLVQQLDGSNNAIETTEAKLYGGNEFYANVDLPVGTNTVRIKVTDIHGESSSQDYSVPVAADSGDSFIYDDAGNLTTWTKSDGTVVEYTWDAANRLRQVKVDSVSIKTFEYDGAGRMVRSSNGTQADDYFWDGLERLGREQFTISSGGVTVYRRYLTQGFTHSDGINPVEKYFTLRDHLGSTREVLDDSYATVAEYDYSAWGEVTKLSGSIDADRLYTGHLYFADADTPLHLAPYRAYQPDLGRWLSRDFAGELGPDGPNVFSYSRNNPLLFSDPTGLYSVLGLEFDEGRSFFSNVGDYIGSARSGAKMGAAAYADGFLPGDPFENAGYYNSDCYGLGASKLLGNVGQVAAITALTAGAANAGYLANLSRFGNINKWSVQFGVRLNKSKQFLRFGVERHIINAFKGSKFPGAAPITHLQLGRLHVILNPLRWRSHGIFRL